MKVHTGRSILSPRDGLATALIVVLLGALPGPATATDTAAVGDGNWSSAATWTNGVPGATDNAYIGVKLPSAAATATVTLTANSSAGVVQLGQVSGTSGTLDLGGFKLTANQLSLGPFGGTGSILRTGGGSLSISDGITLGGTNSFSFAPGDTAASLWLDNYFGGATATTSAIRNVTGSILVDSGCTLNLGADLQLTGTLYLRGTVNRNGHSITAQSVSLGQSGFNLTSADRVTQLTSGVDLTLPANVSVQGLRVAGGATVSTTAVNNVTGSAAVDPGGTLSLGADLRVSSASIRVDGTLNANGHTVSAKDITMGQLAPFSLANRGPITATTLTVYSQNSPVQTVFNLAAGDTVTSDFYLFGVNTTLPAGAHVNNVWLMANNASSTPSTVTTTAPDNLSGYVYVKPSATLNLGADLSAWVLYLSGTLNANGHAISADITLGGEGPAVFQNTGLVKAFGFIEQNGSQAHLTHPGDSAVVMALKGSSTLTVHDAAGQTAGLTLANMLVSGLTIEPGSQMTLEVNGLADGWVFRWANPSGGDHIADLQSLIGQGQVTFSSLNGGSYGLSADSAYTYVNVVPVPEPSVLALSVAAAGLLAGVRRRRRQ